MPWRATWSSMCSRNGMPVASLAVPVPSRFTRTRICVSLVLRSTSAVLGFTSFRSFLQRLSQSCDQYTVFLGRADGEPQAVGERWQAAVEVAHEHALCAKAFIDLRAGAGRALDAREEKVGHRRIDLQARQALELGPDALALGEHPGRLLIEHLLVLQELHRHGLGDD